MKKLLILLSLLLILGSLPVAALEEPDMDYYGRFKGQNIEINVYNWGEYISSGEDDSIAVNREFEALTGIKVNYTTFATNEELFAKLRSGGASYDIIIPSDYMIARMIQEEMLEPLDFSAIPNFEYIEDDLKNPQYDPQNAYSVPYMWGTVGIIYNSEKVTEAFDSWDILWNEKYKGNILMFGNPRDALGIALIRLGYSINTENEDELRAAAKSLKEQKPLVQAYVMDEIFDKMEGGEAAVAPYYAGDALSMMANNPALGFVIPKEGTNRFVDAVCIPKNAPNKEAAHLYINFLTEPEISAANSEYIGYSTPNTAALELLDEEITANEIAYPSDEVLDKTEPFLHLSNETNVLMDSLWVEIMSNDANFGKLIMPVFVVVAIIAAVAITVYRSKKKKKDSMY